MSQFLRYIMWFKSQDLLFNGENVALRPRSLSSVRFDYKPGYKSYVTSYKFDSSHWLKLQHSDWREYFNQWEKLKHSDCKVTWFITWLIHNSYRRQPPSVALESRVWNKLCKKNIKFKRISKIKWSIDSLSHFSWKV